MPGNSFRRSPTALGAGGQQCLLRWATCALFIALLLATVGVLASEPPPLLFSPTAGLSDSAFAFLQDRQGYLWIGTGNGLYRHDGYRSVRYQHDASVADSLPDDTATSLLEDRRGRLWVGTYHGLARFEAKTGTFTHFYPPSAADGNQQNRLIRSIVGDGQDGLWLATRAGLQHFDPDSGQFTHYRHDPNRADSLPDDNVSVLARDAQNGLWVATWPSGLAYLAHGSDRMQRYSLNCALKTPKNACNVRALLVDSRQRLWIGTDSGVLLWQSGTPWANLKRLPPPPGVGKFRGFSIAEDATGTIWIGTLQDGLLRWDETQNAFLHYAHQTGDARSLPAGIIRAVLVDRSQILWVGAMGGNVSRSDLASQGIEQVIPERVAPESFKNANIMAGFAEDGQGNLWLGGRLSGVSLVNLTKRSSVRSARLQPGQAEMAGVQSINHLYRQPGGSLWSATNAGLAWLAPGSERWQIKLFEGTGNNAINVIAPGKGDVLWLGTGGGILRYSPTSGASRLFRHLPGDPHSLAPGANSTLLEDRSGNLWAGGEQAGARGLCVLDPTSGRVRHYRHDAGDNTSLSSDIIKSIHQDDRGGIWLGTSVGLNRASRADDGTLRFTRYGAAQPVSSVQSDSAYNIWARIPSGLLRLDAKTGEIRTYAASEGAPEGSPLDVQGFRSEDGTLYFAGLHGFSIVKPDAVRQNLAPPQAAITDVSVFNHSLHKQPATDDVRLDGAVTNPQRLQLSWKAAVFSLELAALHYADPARNRLAYRLDGFDQDWVEADAEHRVATYTNLDPGEYRFRVKAASSNGVWSESEVHLPIIITPPFWKTTLFKSAFLLSVLLLLALIYRWRVRHLIQNQAHLEQLVSERTRQLVEKDRAKTRFLASASHDLRQPLQAITLFLGVLKHSALQESQSIAVCHLDASVAALRGLLNSLLDISKLDAGVIVPVWQTVSLNHLFEFLTLELSPLAVDKNLRFMLFFPARELTLRTDPQLLKTVLQNLIANAIAYTPRGGILLAARLCGKERNQVSIEIWDTGIGIHADEQAHIFEEFYQVGNPQRDRNQGLGLGLAIVKRTLGLLNLPIVCRSRVGRGSVFAIRAGLSPCTPALEWAAAPGLAEATNRGNIVPVEDVPLDWACFVGKRFIVVEDDVSAATALRLWLHSIGGEVIVYSSVDQALDDTAQVYSGDYYISDFRLPGQHSGLDFLNIIQSRLPAPCVLVTGDTSSKFIENIRQTSLQVLFKPITPEQLLQALRN